MAKIDKLAMRQGYKEMAEINLTITKEDFHLEDEGAKIYEMATEETKKEA
jgi:hypothetical protein